MTSKGSCCQALKQAQFFSGVAVFYLLFKAFTTNNQEYFILLLWVAMIFGATIGGGLDDARERLAGAAIALFAPRTPDGEGPSKMPVVPSSNARLLESDSAAGATAETSRPVANALTPAQASLHRTADNPYGNYRLYDQGPMNVYKGPMGTMPDYRLERGAFGTAVADPGLQYYTLPDSTGIAHMRPPVSLANYGPPHTTTSPGVTGPGGLWVGR